MQGFDLLQLHSLRVVAEAGSLTAAAPRLFLSQSAVSEHMRKLEAACGQPLLLRSKSGVVLTPAGTRLLAHAQRILALSEQAWNDLCGPQLQGHVRLGVSDYFRPQALASLLAHVAEVHPGLRLHVQVMHSSQVRSMWQQGALDLGLCMQLEGDAEGASTLCSEALHWVAAPHAVFAQDQPVPLVLLPAHCSLHHLAVQRLASQGQAYEVVHLASGVAGLQAAVAAGLGVGCVNTSSLGAGMQAWKPQAPRAAWPALPAVQFQLLPLRAGASSLVAQVRAALLSQWAALPLS
ncbi:LysR family transcriptional regulator [Comamonas sp. GB3 AK4-5]|uniref:LysR family transcriptional regulator n=1 Tax=Comamonas sp. GB3 AK4-5 TaxID=3231487 RepID=UPI00351DC523